MAKIPAVPTNLTATMAEFDARFDSWLKACQEKIDEKFKDSITPGFKLVREGGKTYIKIVERYPNRNLGASVHCFVDARNGNIYKAATWKAPALNHARGNILDADNGMKWMSEYGTAYMDQIKGKTYTHDGPDQLAS
jgi:hypothetical protein